MIWIALLACKDPDPDAGVLPPDDTAWSDRDTEDDRVPLDTQVDTGLDQTPAHTVTLHHEGRWELSPFGGPYVNLVGTLSTWEYLDGDKPDPDTADPDPEPDPNLLCETQWGLVGAVLDEDDPAPCDVCDVAFTVTHTLVQGDPAACVDPDLPRDGERLRFGLRASDNTLLHDVGGSGLWTPWYSGLRAGDVLTFEWDMTLGVVPQDTP